jgi:putative tricarboxylic transport membrane protein
MSWKPDQEIEIIAGTPPGGGLDRSARALLRTLEAEHLLPVTAKVVNVGGDGGRKAWVHIDRYAGNSHVLGISSPNMAADYLMGVTTSDPDRFVPLAILYSEYIAFVVRKDSPVANGAELVARFAKDAAAVTVALSTSLGNSNHVAVAKVIQHAGGNTSAPTIRVFDTALDVVADVIAGNCDVGAVTAASVLPELEAGKLAVIAISSPRRLAGAFASAPTWLEQGVDCVIGSWRGVSGAEGLSEEQVWFWQAALRAAVKSAQWQLELASHYWTDMYLDGAALRTYLARERADMEGILGQLGLLRRQP